MTETTFRLPAQSGIAQAEELHQQLDGMLLSGQTVVLDASAVERVDTAVLQLLCSFVGSAGESGVQVRWGGISENFTAAASLLGLRSSLLLS